MVFIHVYEVFERSEFLPAEIVGMDFFILVWKLQISGVLLGSLIKKKKFYYVFSLQIFNAVIGVNEKFPTMKKILK